MGYNSKKKKKCNFHDELDKAVACTCLQTLSIAYLVHTLMKQACGKELMVVFS